MVVSVYAGAEPPRGYTVVDSLETSELHRRRALIKIYSQYTTK